MLADVHDAASRCGWQIQSLTAAPGIEITALHRPAPETARAPVRIYLSAGIHGDEPAGPLAAQQLIEEDRWPRHCELWFCPCLNPTGFPRGTRESAAGVDLNRDYLQLQTPEIRAHVGWLEQQPRFDLTLGLHEDWEAKGFYLYELNPSRAPARSRAMLAAVADVCPMDPSPMIDGRPADAGLIQPDLDPAQRPQWPEAFWLVMNRSPLSYTLEAPSAFPMATRVAALVAGVRAALSTV